MEGRERAERVLYPRTNVDNLTGEGTRAPDFSHGVTFLSFREVTLHSLRARGSQKRSVDQPVDNPAMF